MDKVKMITIESIENDTGGFFVWHYTFNNPFEAIEMQYGVKKDK